MNLFKSDFFSVNTPIWNDCKEERSNDIKVLFIRFYPHLGISIKKIQQVGGIEINSSNYSIETSEGRFLLKKWGDSLTNTAINEICRLTSGLTAKKIPISKLITSIDQSFVVNIYNNKWSLFEFVEGDYFSGTIQELGSVAMEVGLLFNNLAEVDIKSESLQNPEIRSANDLELFKNFFINTNSFLDLFKEKERELLISYKELLQSEVDQIYNSRFDLGKFQFSHFDLHPHNILIKNGKLSSFLDIDSIRLIHSGYALSFASLKLCRQCVVKTGKTPKDVAGIWIDLLSESMPQNNQWIPFIADLAIAEVMRRIAIILRLNLIDRNPQWNNFLLVQLNHLKEARLLFNS